MYFCHIHPTFLTDPPPTPHIPIQHCVLLNIFNNLPTLIHAAHIFLDKGSSLAYDRSTRIYNLKQAYMNTIHSSSVKDRSCKKSFSIHATMVTALKPVGLLQTSTAVMSFLVQQSCHSSGSLNI